MKKIISIFLLLFFFVSEIHSENSCSCTATDPFVAPAEPPEEVVVKDKLCSGCDSEKDCRWFQIDSTQYTCLNCAGITDDSEKKYYSKGLTFTGEPYCHKLGITGFSNRKIIYGSNQIVKDCQDLGLYEMGDVCYHYNPNSNTIDLDETNKKLKCKYYNYKHIEDGLIYYNCLTAGETCPSELNYFDADTKECFNACPNGKTRLSIVKEGDKIYYGCYSTCKDEYDKEYTIKISSTESKTYCYKECPPQANYYYENDKKCIQKCNKNPTKDFFNKDKKCTQNINDCGATNIYFLINPKINFYSCNSGESPYTCPDDYPYTYSNNGITYCLTSCDDTNTSFFNNEKTYLYLERKICTATRPTDAGNSPNIYYLDEIGKRWVTDCQKVTSGPFHSGDKCVSSCGTKYLVEDTYECVNSCNSTKYKTDEQTKTCVENCPSYLGRGFYNDSNKCVECGVGKGYHKKDDNKCKTSCSDFDENGVLYKYNYQNNICFTGECKDNINYKYSNPNNNRICYNSCTDIGTNYKYEKDYKCYSSIPGDVANYYFYNSLYGLIKYVSISNNAAKVCFSLGLKFLKNSECIAQCGANDYIVYPKQNPFSMGLCLSSITDCLNKNYKFYNNSKICDNVCDYYTINDDTGTTQVNNENCVLDCPTEYPFLDGKICKSQCSSYYKEESGKKKCVSTCSTYIKEEADGKKKCVDFCSEEPIQNGIPKFTYYYINNNNEKICVGSCKEISKFSEEATFYHQECKTECPTGYYHDKNNICLKKCENYYEGNLCVDNWYDCPNNYFIHPGKKCINEACPKDAQFYYKKTNGGKTLKECVFSCNKYFIKNTDGSYECIDQEPQITLNIYKAILYGELIEDCNKYNKGSDNICTTPTRPVNYTGNYSYFTINEGIVTGQEECNSPNFVTTIHECISQCPLGQRFIKNGNQCVSNCNNEFYKLKSNGNYNIYECIGAQCPSEGFTKHKENEKECINDCGSLYDNNNICYSSCSNNNKLMIKNNKMYCQNDCDNNYFYGEKKICETNCSFLSTKIMNKGSKQCINQCDKTSSNKYLQIKNGQLYCSNSCEDTNNKKYIEGEYICKSKCTLPKNHVNGNICQDSCPKNKILINDEYICSDNCNTNGYLYYYKSDNICISRCYPGDYNVQGTKECVKNCTGDKKYFYDYDSDITSTASLILDRDTCVSDCKSTNKPYTRENNHCDSSCDSDPSGDYYYNDNDKICKRRCDSNTEKTDGNLCKSACDTQASAQNKYKDEKNNCISSCSTSNTGYIYTLENDDFVCRNACLNVIDGNICKNSCPNTGTNKYKYTNQCVPKCPENKKFYIENENICLDDCPQDKPYYTVSSSNLFKCQQDCGAYIRNSITNKNALFCLGNDCIGTYPYFITEQKNGKTIKKCLSECPANSYYSTFRLDGNNNKNLECNVVCSQKSLYYFDGYYKCIPSTLCKFIDYDNKGKCILGCSEGQVIYETNSLSYCLNSCSDYKEKTLYLNYENKCVESCKEGYEKVDSTGKKCECKNLYFDDKSRRIKVCLNEEENTCEKQLDYPYLLSAQKKCIDKCNGIISLDGLYCNDNNYQCPSNTKVITLNNGMKQCFCEFKYYYKTSLKKDLVCLGKDEKCPRNNEINRELLIKETRECVEYCPFDIYTKKYGMLCVELCPLRSIVYNDECFCQDKWYMDENDEMICVNQCPDEKPIMIAQTKQCIESCKNTKYPIYYRKNCYTNCTLFANTKQIYVNDASYVGYRLEDLYGKYGEQICICEGVWYEDNGKGGCYEGNNCNVLDGIYTYKYQVTPINQCVSSCPQSQYFNYSFNNQCFESCEKANELLEGYSSNSLKRLIKGESNTCICSYLWKYNDEDKSKIECIEQDKCPSEHLLIVATKECYKSSQCRQEYPLLFNKKCYNENNCPANTIYKEEYPKTCSCIGYYYIKDNNDNIENEENGSIICLPEGQDCHTGNQQKPNLIYSKNKCVANGDSELNDLLLFNGIYYNYCPFDKRSVQKENSNECICDILYGYWYQNEGYLKCGLDNCPQDNPSKPIYKDNTKECISDCLEEGMFNYNDICYESCPPLTDSNADNICELEPSYETNNITEATETIKNNLVNLYHGSKKDQSHVIEITNTDTTVEFYGVTKDKSKNKEKHNTDKRTSSLSYIDLSECIQQIYETNSIYPSDDVIILKYDLTNTPKDYLINPVEYKFINSRNGDELDASACGHGSIKISYPFFNIIKNLDNLAHKKRNLQPIKIEIKNDNDLSSLIEKYNIGKKINGEYKTIDTFNSKDSIYTDFCTSIEINGKDLVLEDRMNNLLPHYSLCEQNCTYNRTDFEEERIYCDCSFKTEFDLKREHHNIVEINENAVTQSQDGTTNFPVLKCISILGNFKRIKGNIAFYYMLIIFIIEVIFLLLTIFLGYKSFKLYLNNNTKENNITEENLELEINNKKKRNIYDDEVVKTTHRELNNPPIKKKNNKKEDPKEERNEIEFIPEEFVFLYFNKKDKGVKKQVEKSDLPFDIKENTKILLQKIENYDYTNLKADGPFSEDQNIIEIIFNEEEKIKLNFESNNESITDNDNYINEKINIKNKLNEKEILPIAEEKIYKRESLKNYIINEFDEVVEDQENKGNTGCFDEIKLEQRLLTKEYIFHYYRNDNKFFTLILTEILDKIYIVKNILFLRKYEIVYLYLSVYLLYHAILLSFLAMFFNINTIKNIWKKENYPGFGFYLGYGILAAIIAWVIYTLFICLFTNRSKYNEIMLIKKSKKKQNKIHLINQKVNSIISKMKIKMIVYYIIQFIILIFFFIYLVTLCAVYSGTTKKIFTSYGIAIIEIIIIKILYGLILGILRFLSISNQQKGLYSFILFLDKYIV